MNLKKRIRGDTLAVAIFLGPSLIGFTIFFLGPFLSGFYYSLVDSPINGRFVGIKNYIDLLSNSSFLKAAKNTLVFTALSVPLIMTLSLALAFTLCKNIRFRSFLRTSFIIPLAIPVASVVFVWQTMFNINGTLNGLITAIGYQPIDWMKTDLARVVVIIVYLWKNTGYNMVLFIAGIQNIPAEYYESASIDGASSWQKFKSITLIYLTPTTFFVFIISVINSFKVFRETYLISGEYPHDSIYMLQHYMNNMFINLDYQKLTSAAFIMALVIVLLISILFKIERKISNVIS